MPQINNLAGSYGDRGLVVLAINLWQSLSICQTYQNMYPNILVLRDTSGSVWNVYNINNYIPCNYLIDHDLDQTVDYRGTGYSHSTYTSMILSLLSPVSVELTPYNTTVQAGGVLSFDVERHNWDTASQTYFIKIDMEVPAGGYQSMYDTRKLTQGGGTIKVKTLNYNMPGGSSVGSYTCRCMIGLKGDLWYQDTFDFEVIP